MGGIYLIPTYTLFFILLNEHTICFFVFVLRVSLFSPNFLSLFPFSPSILIKIREGGATNEGATLHMGLARGAQKNPRVAVGQFGVERHKKKKQQNLKKVSVEK